MTNRQVKRALRTLKQFCYSHERCGSCLFGEFRQDMGFTCYVQNIIDDERFLKAVSENVPDPNECKLCKWRAICGKKVCSGFERDLMATDPTVTISPGTIQYQPMRWEGQCEILGSVKGGPYEILPEVKVRPNGEWIDKGRDDDVYDIKGVKTWATKGMCSKCGFTAWFIESHFCYMYCPQCGAKMKMPLPNNERRNEMRDCENCVHARPYGGENDNRCGAWECEYINRDEAIKTWRASKWIPLHFDGMSTDFPYERDGEWVLVTDGKCISVERIKKDAYDHFYPNGRWFEIENVIAWMPLPEPWKGETDGKDQL